MSSKKYLVTGGTGFIGSALVRRLVKEGHTVTVFDNNSRGLDHSLSDVQNQIHLIVGDIRKPADVQKACQNIDSVFHLAFVNGTEFFYEKPDLVLDVGIKGMSNILDACIDNNIKEFILASSSEVYQTPPVIPTDETAPLSIPDPLNPRYSYATGKIASEIMAINYGRKHFERVLIFRPHNVYGSNMGWEHVIPQLILKIKDRIKDSNDSIVRLPIQGTGKETRAFVYIDDFIDGLMVMANKGEHLNIYHIGSEEEVSINTLIQELGQYFNKTIETDPGELQKGGTLRRCPDITKIKSLGYQPKYPLSTGLPITADWYVKNTPQQRIAS